MRELLEDTRFNGIIREFLENLESSLKDPFYSTKIEDIETESRPGYIPHSHNYGGFKLKAFSDLRGFFGSGSHYGTHAEELIEALIDRDRRFSMENGDLVDGDEASEDKWLEGLGDETNSVYLEVMCMYHGADARGIHSMEVNAYIEGSDAPYHRGTDLKFETVITWRTESGLKRKLEELNRKLEKFCLIRKGTCKQFETNRKRSIYGYNISPFRDESKAVSNE